MSDAVRFPLVLGLISLCSAAGLAVSYTVTRDEIRFQQELTKARGLAAVLGVELDEKAMADPDAPRPWKALDYPGRKGQPEGGFTVYQAADPGTGRAVFAAEGRAQGYSSKVAVVVGAVHSDEAEPTALTVRRVKVVSQLETPGLGSRCTEPGFQRQFDILAASRLKLLKGVPYRDPSQGEAAQHGVAAITGATVTSNAVVRAVRQALSRVGHHIEQQRGR